MGNAQQGWKLYIPASPTGRRRAYNFSHLGTLERAKGMVPSSLRNLAAKQGIWTLMSEEEIEAEEARLALTEGW